ncbi:MAG: hypothetical protein ACRDQW_13180 [Haloechinothrix sp.]
MPGGPFVPPPCRRCRTTDDFFASDLCSRCHLYGSPAVDSCADCCAWGATRTNKWLCHGCRHWRQLHSIGTCTSCNRAVTVNGRSICRLCWKNASGHRTTLGVFDPIGPNRNGQQLFFADMQRAASRRCTTPHTNAPLLRPARPVAHHQLLLFTMARDLAGGRSVVGPPRDPVLAEWLDAQVTHIAGVDGWDWRLVSKVRAGIRLLLGLQDTPGAAITRSELAVLPQFFVPQRQVAIVLDAVGMLEDDRAPAIARWFTNETCNLPGPMGKELGVWFDVMHRGSTSPPRRRPRSPTTIKLYTRAAVPALRRWATAGHDSLREITRAEVLAALPVDPTQRKFCGQAMRSIFGILKGRKLIFTNPAVRLAHNSDSPVPPAAMNLDAVRQALDSPDPVRAAIAALIAFHGLRSHELRDLKLTDIRDRHLHLDERVIPLAEPVRRRLRAWLDYRNARWPTSTNPHLFIHFRTAGRDEPVGTRWVFLTLALPGGPQALRADRILHEATATNGDPRRLCDLFGLSIQHATRYTDAIREPILTP